MKETDTETEKGEGKKRTHGSRVRSWRPNLDGARLAPRATLYLASTLSLRFTSLLLLSSPFSILYPLAQRPLPDGSQSLAVDPPKGRVKIEEEQEIGREGNDPAEGNARSRVQPRLFSSLMSFCIVSAGMA